MFALVFVHPVKADGSLGIRSCPAKSMAEAISLVIGLTCKWSICVYSSKDSVDSEGWDYRIDSTRNTHGTRGIVTWQEHRELNVFLPNYDGANVWFDMHQLEKKFRHNIRAWLQRQRKLTQLSSNEILLDDVSFSMCVTLSKFGI